MTTKSPTKHRPRSYTVRKLLMAAVAVVATAGFASPSHAIKMGMPIKVQKEKPVKLGLPIRVQPGRPVKLGLPMPTKPVKLGLPIKIKKSAKSR